MPRLSASRRYHPGMPNPDRLPPIPPERWTPDQRRHAQEIIAGPRGALISPFVPMLRSPELMAHSQRMGEYLRYRSAIGLRLSELAILLVARHWTQQVEWAIHAPIAQREGVAAATIAAIAAGTPPQGLPEDEAAVHDFTTELLRDQQVSDPTWARAVSLFGEQGVVDLVGLAGYYAYLAMLMNAARTPVPATQVEPLAPLR
jgi:4-carboxymuconolactone decarboxylase